MNGLDVLPASTGLALSPAGDARRLLALAAAAEGFGGSARALREELGPVMAGVAAWLRSQRSEHTRAAYARDVARLARWAAERGLTLEAVERGDLEAWDRAEGQAGRSSSTRARQLAGISSMLSYLTAEGALPRNAAANVKRPLVPDASGVLLDRQQMLAILGEAERCALGPPGRDAALVGLLMTNGLRVSEPCSVGVEDLSEERGHRVLRVTRKGGKIVAVPLPARTWRAVDAAAGGRDAGPLLLANDGSRLTRQQAGRAVARIARRAGLTAPVTPHVLRAAAITELLDAGVSLHRVQDFAGHIDPRTTRGYDRRRDNLDGSAAYVLGDLLGV